MHVNTSLICVRISIWHSETIFFLFIVFFLKVQTEYSLRALQLTLIYGPWYIHLVQKAFIYYVVIAHWLILTQWDTFNNFTFTLETLLSLVYTNIFNFIFWNTINNSVTTSLTLHVKFRNYMVVECSIWTV